jgi:tetratricopeptide (TPR) repeat protein
MIMSKTKKILIAVIVAVLLIIGVVAFILINKPSTEVSIVASHISLAENYLLDLNYEAAIAEYRMAIRIDPKNADYYIALAEVYIEMSDTEAAIEVLEEGLSAVEEADRERIKAVLEELYPKPVETSVTTVSTTTIQTTTTTATEPTTVPETTATTATETTLNLITNEDNPYDWHIGYDWRGNSEVFFDSEVSYDDKYSICINHPTVNDTYVSKVYIIKPNTDYSFSAYVKCDFGEISDTDTYAYGTGANIGKAKSWYDHSDFIQDNNWAFVTYDFNSDDNTEIELCLRLGMYSGTCTGTAWFSNIELIER